MNLYIFLLSVILSGDSQPVDEAPSNEPERYLIRYQFYPEQTLSYESVQTISQTAATPKGNKLDLTKTRQTRVFTVENVKESGEADVRMQFAHVSMEMKANDEKPVKYDSTMADNEVPSIFRSTARRLKGAAAKFKVKATGTPVKDGIQVIPEAGQASFMMPLPAEPIAVGDTWKANIVSKVRIAEGVMRNVTLLRTYRLKSVEDGMAKISFSTSIQNSVRSPRVKALLLQSTPQGSVDFDLERGVVTRRVMKFDSTVVGGLGPKTMLSAVGQTIETLKSVDAKVSAR